MVERRVLDRAGLLRRAVHELAHEDAGLGDLEPRLGFEVLRQAEIDELYGKLLAGGGTEQACGWVQDRFGPIWQVNYKRLPEMIASGGSEAADRAFAAMMTMKKIDVKKLEDAYAGKA